MKDHINYFVLGIIALISMFLYVLSILDKEEVQKHNRRKGYVLRRATTGAIGSAICVWLAYETAIYFGLPNSFSLAISGFVGFLGADVLSRMFEKVFNRFIDNKLPPKVTENSNSYPDLTQE